MAAEITLTLLLERVTCSECGITHGLPATYRQSRADDHKTFYCPNGHAQHYPGESETERLRRNLRAETLARESADRRTREALQAQEAAEKEVKRLKTRAKAGVCPCCNRTFQQLAAHMKNKHPEMKP